MNKHNIKLFVSDIDGTLFNSRSQLSDVTIETIRELVKNGGKFAIATGRNISDARTVLSDLGVSGCYLIGSNGATIQRPSGELLDLSLGIEPEIVKQILDIEIKADTYQNIYQGYDWLMNRPEMVFHEYYRKGDIKPQLVDLNTKLDRGAEKIFFTSHNISELERIKNIIDEKFGDVVTTTYSMPYCLEMMKKGVNKSTAIEIISKELGISFSDIATFGDAMNDYEMIENAKFGFIMGNCSDELKARSSKEVIKSNNENGVALKIKELYFGE